MRMCLLFTTLLMGCIHLCGAEKAKYYTYAHNDLLIEIDAELGNTIESTIRELADWTGSR